MEILTYKVPLLMYSNTEIDPRTNSMCLVRKMADIDTSAVQGIDELFGVGSWLQDYKDYSSNQEEIERMLRLDKENYGFNSSEVIMDVKFSEGYYIIEFLSDLPFNTPVNRHNWFSSDTVSLKEAIKSWFDGQLSDGIGENQIGTVSYGGTTHEVWLGDAIEI